MMSPAPGLWKRKLPSTLGSWRVESVVDSEEPNSMFVFLFDDGSGESFAFISVDKFSVEVTKFPSTVTDTAAAFAPGVCACRGGNVTSTASILIFRKH